ncbi:YfbK domain-containing protein [Solitalea canadensis]|uniref:Uncharacterized protein containing a von Willebrand factor type A (VWA) domain n=1 Tax=Solitalea canadensis (strain ATCC 29591 / DSM 3403 / JCM 21819 / LMG 8368 / NBRC 15130 / NCIMB 12057 / USAM 9D) TaxID=929556 RepID=H8KM19_SOLCM|nr:von Willebrand factor type A domain-containing protein [Solitalea canadensis]AFD08941.1 uncharacterized protein containing a von Willebrand factor type A (vWA) domain [Solitalea canadensis DSM 3403]
MRTSIHFFFLILLAIASSCSQSRTVKGRVTSAENGKLINRAEIQFEGSIVKSHTNKRGVFFIKATDSARKLTIKAKGYEPKELIIGNDSVVDVALVPEGYVMYEIAMPVKDSKVREEDQCKLKVASRTMVIAYDRHAENINTEDYSPIAENGFRLTSRNALSTFSIDVDNASYSNIRRFINTGQIPPVDAVRIEEMINYFNYDYGQPKGKDPVVIHTDVAECPWNPVHKLARIGIQTKNISAENLPPSNLVFLIDVSGSMEAANKLPLVVSAFKLLINQMRSQDKVSIVVYAGASGTVLNGVSGTEKMKISDALTQLKAGGSTAGGEGIQLAYKVARQNYIKGGNNRVILATDGDFNVGVSSDGELVSLIEEERKDNVFLSVLGFGMGNYKDNKLELLANKGNGNYAYIDGFSEARKVFVNEFGGTLFTLAKDVKLQVEFNPAVVKSYRLIGYENRLLNDEDFNNDKIDAGEIGSGQTVTALYEVIPVGVKSPLLPDIDSLKYQKNQNKASLNTTDLLTVKLRYKEPTGNEGKLMTNVLLDKNIPFTNASADFRFAASVAEFGMLLRSSPYKKGANYDHLISLASKSLNNDSEGYKSEFLKLVRSAKSLSTNNWISVIGEK